MTITSRVLRLFEANIGKVVTHEVLSAYIWPERSEMVTADYRYDVIRRIRRMGCNIVIRKGYGYMMVKG